MRKIRKGIFETNSSSAHSLVICKSDIKSVEDLSDRIIWIDRVFGSDLEDFLYGHIEYDWDEDGNLYYEKFGEGRKDYRFDFSRGNPRTYNDFIHKIAFMIAYYKYSEDNEIDIILDKAKKILDELFETEEFKNGYRHDEIIALTKKFIDTEFRDEKIRDEIISSEFDHSNTIMVTLLKDDDLFRRFIFNSNSYISISGDEYKGYYFKVVGCEYDYTDMYGQSEGKIEFEDRINKVYKDDEYIVESDI